MRREKEYPAEHLSMKKYPARQVAKKKKLADQKSPPPPSPQEFNGRPLKSGYNDPSKYNC